MAKNSDKKRMDWLEEVSGKFYGIGYPEGDKVYLEWDTGDDEDHVEADTLREAIDLAMKQGVREKRALTGKELKFAAENKLQVRFVETYHNPHDEHKNYDDVCVMEEANIGYYIGDSDIVPSEYGDNEEVRCNFDEGVYVVYAVPGVKYEEESDE